MMKTPPPTASPTYQRMVKVKMRPITQPIRNVMKNCSQEKLNSGSDFCCVNERISSVKTKQKVKQRSCCWLVGWLQGHLETTPTFTVPCEGREVRFLHRSHRESIPGPSRDSPLHYRCATPAPQ